MAGAVAVGVSVGAVSVGAIALGSTAISGAGFFARTVPGFFDAISGAATCFGGLAGVFAKALVLLTAVLVGVLMGLLTGRFIGLLATVFLAVLAATSAVFETDLRPVVLTDFWTVFFGAVPAALLDPAAWDFLRVFLDIRLPFVAFGGTVFVALWVLPG